MRSIETPHFRVADGHIQPRFPVGISNELTDHIAAELVPLGLVPGNAAFEQIFVESVLAGQPDPMRAWAVFYANTMRRLRRPEPVGTGTVATFARIYAHALSLVRGVTVLDVGCCFGFLPLLAAEQDPIRRVIGTDLVPTAAALASRISWANGSHARFAAADLLALPVAAEAVDTVLAIHVLEHLPAQACPAALAQLRRVARRRVVIAVPLEEVPDPLFGHVQAFDLPTLARIGLDAGAREAREPAGWSRAVHAADGGWLVLDRVPQSAGPTHCPIG